MGWGVHLRRLARHRPVPFVEVPVLGLIGRFFVLRFLPRRLLPVLTAIEVFRWLRGRRSTPPAVPKGRARVGR